MLLFFATLAFADDLHIAAHLQTVVDTLRAETPADLPDEIRARRLDYLDLLEDYAADGIYPENQPDHLPTSRRVEPPRAFVAPDTGRAPTFVDGRGVHCAVGYLMAVDHPDMVARVVSEANHAYLPDMEVDGLEEWAAWAGFTPTELAWIQPQYPTGVGTCPRDLSEYVWESGGHRDEREACGSTAVSIQQFQSPCEMCGEGHAINVTLTNFGNDEAVVDVVVRSPTGEELGRERDVDLRVNRRAGVMVLVPDWQAVTNNGSTVSVEADGNCAAADAVTVELRTFSSGAPLDPPRCGVSGGCSATATPGSIGWIFLSILSPLFWRRRRAAQPE